MLRNRPIAPEPVGLFPRRRPSAFTLLELLVVLSLVAMLAALIYPASQRIAKNGQSAACVGNLRQLGIALNAYLSEHNLMMPELRAGRSRVDDDVPVIDNTLDRYVDNRAVFQCPGDKGGIGAVSGTSYFWNVALNNQSLANLHFLNFTSDHSRIPILSDKEGFHPYIEHHVNILYADGHATKDLKFWTDDGLRK